MTTELHRDPHDDRTLIVTIDPDICHDCEKRAKCLYREQHQQHRCGVFKKRNEREE